MDGVAAKIEQELLEVEKVRLFYHTNLCTAARVALIHQVKADNQGKNINLSLICLLASAPSTKSTAAAAE